MSDVAQWLRREIARCERRLEQMKALLALLEQSERIEEIKAGRKKIARVMTGENYVRLVFEEPIKLPQEIREYLGTIEEELRALQARTGEEQARLRYYELNGGVIEIRYDMLYTRTEMLKAKGALKYAAEAAYQLGGNDGRET